MHELRQFSDVDMAHAWRGLEAAPSGQSFETITADVSQVHRPNGRGMFSPQKTFSRSIIIFMPALISALQLTSTNYETSCLHDKQNGDKPAFPNTFHGLLANVGNWNKAPLLFLDTSTAALTDMGFGVRLQGYLLYNTNSHNPTTATRRSFTYGTVMMRSCLQHMKRAPGREACMLFALVLFVRISANVFGARKSDPGQIWFNCIRSHFILTIGTDTAAKKKLSRNTGVQFDP